MDPEVQREADRRFEAALEHTGAHDPRERYREMLRELRGRGGDAYRAAVEEYRSSVLEPIAGGAEDPLQAWLDFGCRLAQRLHPGRTVVLDAGGRAHPLSSPPSWEQLILHLPDDRKLRAVPIGLPPELTAAQRASVDLLAMGRLRLPEA